MPTLFAFSLENSKMGDRGAVKLANVLVSLGLLEVLKWVQHVVFSYHVRLGITDHIIQPNNSLMQFELTSNMLFPSLSQNCIGDEGMKILAATLRDLPKLHCLR